MSRSFPRRARTARAVIHTLVFASLVAAFAAGVAVANAASHTSAFADTTRPVTFLREVVVTGARYPRAYYQSPQALSFVGPRQLRESAPIVIGDVLGTLPGVDNSKDSPWEQRPVLRGLSGQRVLVLMDGMPMNSSRGNGPHPSLVDPSQIQRVEVVRGPSSVSYGSDALGGAINIITREPRPTDGKTALEGGISFSGSTGENQGGGSLELMPRMGKFSGYGSFGFRSAKNFDSPDGTIANSSFRDWDGLYGLRWDASSNFDVKAGYQMLRGSDVGIPGLTTPLANYGPGNTTTFQFKDYDRDLAHLTLDHRYENSWIAASRLRFYWQAERRNFWSTERIDSAYYAIYGIPSNGSIFRQTDQDRFFDLKTWGAQLQLTSIQTKTYRFTAGVDAARDVTAGNNVRHRDSQFATGPGPVALRITQSVPNGTFDNVGTYFQNEWYVLPKFTLSSGVRWTMYHDRTDAGLAAPASGPTPAQYFEALKVDNNATCGSVGVVYEAAKDLHLSFNVANGYRQPNAQDLFFNGPASVGFVLGDPDLKPEKSVSYDFGLRYENAKEAISANAFWSNYDDLIDAVDVTPAGNPPGAPHTYQYTNISKARIYGVEAECEWVLPARLRARATLSHAIGDITSREANLTLYGADLDRSPLGGVPPTKGTASLHWADRDNRFWAEPSMRWAWRTNRLPLPTPGVGQLTDFKKEYIVGDLMAGWRIDYVHSITVGVRNFTDRNYRESLASLPAPGRSFVASFQASF